MSSLALDDEILMQVEKPARYIGKEINSVVKRPESVDIRMAMCFPDVYEIGMSHLGIQILYDMFNSYEDVWCERVYSPWPDLDKIMREREIPLFGLESQEPVKCLDFLGITLQYEMCYTNILQVLDLSQIPLLAKDRAEDDPIVMGGGPCSYNPEPIADFLERERQDTGRFWIFIRTIRRREGAVRIFCAGSVLCRESMCRDFMMCHTVRMAGLRRWSRIFPKRRSGLPKI